MVQAGTDGLALNCLPLVGLQRSIGTGSQRRCISHPEISQECTTAAIAPVTALMRMAHQHCRPLPDGCTTLPLEAPTTPNQPHLVLWRRFDGWYPQAVLQRGVKPLVVLPHFLVAIYRLPNGALRVRGEGGKGGRSGAVGSQQLRGAATWPTSTINPGRRNGTQPTWV